VAEVRDTRGVPLFFRRALKVAMAAPGGPTFLGIPNTVLRSKATAHIFDKDHFLLPEDIPPRAEHIASVVKLLLNARSPALILGDEVARAGAQAEAFELAELLGMPVFESPLPAFHCFPRHHPLFKGRFDGRGKDVVINVGNYDLGDYGPGDPVIPPVLNDYPFDRGAAVVRIGLDTDSLGRNYPFEIATVANVKLALASIIVGLKSEANPAAITRMRESRWNGATVRKITIDPVRVGNSPMHPDELSWVLDELLDKDAIIVNENLGASNQFLTTGFRPGEKIWIGNSGKSLGWGIGAAIGAKLAQPDRQVVCDIGDGSVMYSVAGFWTQARYGIPVLTVVSNNRNYQTVRLAFNQYGGQMSRTQRYPGLYLGNPDIDFVQLAASQGVAGIRATNASELRSALKAGTAATNEGRPFLVEALVQRTGPGAGSTWFQPLYLGQSRKVEKTSPSR
jgi:thiamine pyrophosphate-dependent acetolactate synthase large subunit-like protein